MNENEVLTELRAAMAETGLRGTLSVLRRAGPIVFDELHEIFAFVREHKLILDYLRGHVTAWDVFVYLIEEKIESNGEPEEFLMFFEGELVTDGFRWERLENGKMRLYVQRAAYTSYRPWYTLVRVKNGRLSVEDVTHYGTVDM